MAGNIEADDLNRPPNDMGKVFKKMSTDEALARNTLKMAQGMLREGYMNDEFGANFVENFEVPARLVTATTMVEHYAGRGRTKDALRVFMHMSVSGFEPNAYCYSIMIRALGAAAGLKKNPNFIVYAKKYFVEMLGKGMQPNEETYKAVLEGIGRGKNKAEAEEECKEFSDYVKAMGFLVLFKKDIEERANHPSSKSETDMLKEHVMKVFEDATKDCEDKDVQERFQCLGKDYETLSYTAVKLFQTLVQIGLVEETNYLLKPLLETGIMPDEAVFTIVIHLYASGKTKSITIRLHLWVEGNVGLNFTMGILCFL